MLYRTALFFKKSWSRILFIILGLGSLIWFLVRVIPKPSRAAYPCMKAAAPLASSFVTYLIGITSVTFLFRKARERYLKSRWLLATVFALLGFAAGLVAIVSNSNDIYASIKLQGPQTPNEPVGIAKGIFPGRVVWVHDPEATNEDCPDSGGSYWYQDQNTDQDVVKDMVSKGIQAMTGTSTDADAWDALFRYFNTNHGRGDVGYTAGEKIVIKINMNAQYYGEAGINTSPHVSYAVLDQLVNVVGVAQSDISIGDPNCSMISNTYQKCSADFPNVTYWRANGAAAPPSTGSPVIHGSDGSFDDVLPQAYVDATYMINLPVFKKHHRAGISITSKNHFGSIAPYTNGAWHLHPSLPVPDANEEGQEPNGDYGVYRCFVDIMGHEDLGGKTVLNLVDGLWSSVNWGHPSIKWRMAPFNNDYPNSLFMSQDPVALQSVCYDFLYEEFDEDHPTEGSPATTDKGPYPHFPGTDDFLHQAADPNLWPEGIEYDPEDDGSILTSLGTHEHWNNAIDKQYTRNLGTGDGIELLKAADYQQITPDNTQLLSQKVLSIYVDSFDVKWFGTDLGLSRFDGISWSELTTETAGITGNGLLSNNIRQMAYERTAYGHEIWLATDAGLSVTGFDIDGISSATTYTPDNSDILSADVRSVGVDSRHNRWTGTPLGLSVYQGSDWHDTSRFMDEDHGWIDFSTVTTGAMASYDKDSLIYIATDSAGVLRFSHDDIDGFTGASAYSSTWSQFSKTVNSITIRDTTQWYGTPYGAFMHLGNASKSFWIHYPVDSGLISPNVRAIEVDDDGNVWFGTDKGLSIKTASGWFQYPGGMQATGLSFEADTMNVTIRWTSGNGLSDDAGLIYPVVNDIKKDFSGNVWVATDGGVEYFEEVPTDFGSSFSAKRVVFMKEGNSGLLYLNDGISLTASSVFGEGDGFNGWSCIYNGDGDSVAVSGLEPNTEYRVMVIEYTGDSGNEVYADEEAEGNPATFITEQGYDNLPVYNDESLSVYPVPFSDYIMVNGQGIQPGAVANFYTMEGKLRKTIRLDGNRNYIPTGDLSEGIYILQIVDGNGLFSYKIRK